MVRHFSSGCQARRLSRIKTPPGNGGNMVMKKAILNNSKSTLLYLGGHSQERSFCDEKLRRLEKLKVSMGSNRARKVVSTRGLHSHQHTVKNSN